MFSLYGSRCKKATNSYSIAGCAEQKTVLAATVNSGNRAPAPGAPLIGCQGR